MFRLEHIKGSDNYTDILSRVFNSVVLPIKKEADIKTIENEAEKVKIIEQWDKETGHGSLSAVKYNVMRRYNRKGMNQMINKYIRNCECCK